MSNRTTPILGLLLSQQYLEIVGVGDAEFHAFRIADDQRTYLGKLEVGTWVCRDGRWILIDLPDAEIVEEAQGLFETDLPGIVLYTSNNLSTAANDGVR
ncbi:MAG: hypothetical protein KDH88_09840 [Chromatiales bacterium]|nr:hypothetical protein [Chromatiales bacterium]